MTKKNNRDNNYEISLPCPRCGGPLMGAIFFAGSKAETIYTGKLQCFSCSRVFEYDQVDGISQWPKREEYLPYLEEWRKYADCFHQEKKKQTEKECKRRNRTGKCMHGVPHS